MDIYLTASQFGKYPGLATSTSVNNCYLLPVYTYVYHHTKPCSIAIVLFDVCLFRDGPLDITGRGEGGVFCCMNFF